MPDKSAREAIARQWQLLHLLPTRGTGKSSGVLCRELADLGMAVSKRTVERDLIELGRYFPVVSDERSRPYGWRWMDDVQLGLPGLELSEAVSLQLMEGFLRPMLPASIVRSLEARFRLAAAKLQAIGADNAASRWVDKVRVVAPTLSLMPPDIPAGVLDAVQEALFADRQIDVMYRNAGSVEPKPLRLHPLGLVQRGPLTYLIATVFEYADPRVLAVHRIVSLTCTELPATRPAGFSLDRYVAAGGMAFGEGTPVTLEARVSPRLAMHLRETPLAPDMKLVPRADHVCLTASVLDTWQLRWWILSQGAEITVSRPAKLRREIRAELQAALDEYVRKQTEA